MKNIILSLLILLIGENEKIYSAEKAISRLNRLAPQIKTGMVRNAGHDIWVAQADLVTTQVLDFLRDPK